MAVELNGELMMKFLTAQTLAMEMSMAAARTFTRISGDVLYKLGVPLETATWPAIRVALVTKYSDPQPLESLNRELFRMGWRAGENVRAFGEKVQDVVRRLRARTLIQYPGEKGQTRAELYEELALQLFVRELPSYVGLAVRMKNPTTLDSAIVGAIAEDAARSQRVVDTDRVPARVEKSATPRVNNKGWAAVKSAKTDRRGCFRCGAVGHFTRECRRGGDRPATWAQPKPSGPKPYRGEPMEINAVDIEALVRQQVERHWRRGSHRRNGMRTD
ncbi:hypothetical protein AAG570_002097 [Ranatra chinensis]|uniref:CCHC-type domain-containing protein n=1 Tax=Ranatra chinensis TaxID=642074 RepID=A0ABD0YB91_9HEMI